MSFPLKFFRNLLLLLCVAPCLAGCDQDDDQQPGPGIPYTSYLKVGTTYYELNSALALYDASAPQLFTLSLYKDNGDQMISFGYLGSPGTQEIAPGSYTFLQPSGQDPNHYMNGHFYYASAKYKTQNHLTQLNSVDKPVDLGEVKVTQTTNGLYEITFKVKFNGQLLEGTYKGEIDFMEG